MIKIYITTISETSFDGADKRLSEYRRVKSQRKKSGAASLAAGLLLDYALREYGLCERDMEYVENEHGKPFFKNCPDIKFSLSHSGEYAACAVSGGNGSSTGSGSPAGNGSSADIGIDAEQFGDSKHVLAIAKRYFTANEYEYVKNSSDIKAAFFRLWTRKESLLKAIGTGISGGLSAYEVLDDEITVGNTEFYFSEISGYENMSITVCAEERAAKSEFITTQMFEKI